MFDGLVGGVDCGDEEDKLLPPDELELEDLEDPESLMVTAILSIQVSSALRKMILHSRREYSMVVGRTRRRHVGILYLV
jgi:hypothetical protein